MINTIWLRTFCTLAETGHFTMTAEKLHMTQSGVSQHIKKLEMQIGEPVLNRESKQFALSETGKKVYAEAKMIVESLSTMQQRVTDDPVFEGTVIILSPGSVGLKLYPHLLAFQCQHPKLNFEYRFAPNNDTTEALLSGSADIGLVTSEPDNDELTSEAITNENLLVVTPREIAQPSWDTLSKLGFIDHPDGKHHANLLLSANFAEYVKEPILKKAGFCNQIGLIPEPVSLGLGFTVLPEYAVESFSKPHLIRAHKLSKPVSETLYLCTRRQTYFPNRIKETIREIKNRLG